MVLKISKLTNPITYTIKRYAKKHHLLTEEHGLERYKELEKPQKAKVYEAVMGLSREKKKIVDLWEMRLFTIGCIEGTVMISIVAMGCVNRDLARCLTQKKIIVIGPYMKISLGLLSAIEITRLTTKFITAYHKKHLSDIDSRLKHFGQFDHLEFLKA